jgi:flagellar basal-body rod protein FlgC
MSFSIFDIAGMGMSAQSIRLNTVASNLANAETVSHSQESAYRSKHPIFSSFTLSGDEFNDDASLIGVRVNRIMQNEKPVHMKYDPSHPQANDQGYVFLSNVNVVAEMADMLSASRAYQTNAQLFNSAKDMMLQTINLGM